MIVSFSQSAWEDYQYWLREDPKLLRRINLLIQDISRNGNQGIGKPEPLQYELSGYWSRRIDQKNRLVYQIEDNQIIIIACRYHYKQR